MYTILVTEDHELVATQRERIMQRSNLVNKLHFLVPPTYDDLDMSATTVTLEYVSPSREYRFEILTQSDELYKDHLEYVLPFNTKLTKEAGEIELQLTFTMVSMDADGNVSQYVRKTSPTRITIVSIAEWSLQMPDDVLTPLDQRILMVSQQMAAVEDLQAAIAYNTPDGLVIDEEGNLSLVGNGERIGNSVEVVVPGTADDEDDANDGMIDLDKLPMPEQPDDSSCDCGCQDSFTDLDDVIIEEEPDNEDDEDYFIDLDD